MDCLPLAALSPSAHFPLTPVRLMTAAGSTKSLVKPNRAGNTHTHTAHTHIDSCSWALSFCGWLRQRQRQWLRLLLPCAAGSGCCLSCLLPLPLSCCDACGVRLVLCMRGGFCLCDNRIYCFIKFVFKLPLPAVPHQLPLCLTLCLPFSLSLSLSRLLCQTMRELFCGFNECPKLAHLIGQFQAVETVKGLSGRLMGLQKSVARFWAPS